MNARDIVVGMCQRPIAFNPIFVDLPGCTVNSALFLSQALYWTDRTQEDEGWFYKTRDEWTKETRLTRREQENARQSLRSCGVLEERLAGNPARLFYRVNCSALAQLLYQLVGTKPPNKTVRNVPASGHESAQLYKEAEITTETTADIDCPPSRKRTSKISLPEDFEPNENNRRVAATEGVDLKKALVEFSEYHRSRGNRMADWNLALNTWLRNDKKFRRDTNGRPKQSSQDRLQQELAISHAYDEREGSNH